MGTSNEVQAVELVEVLRRPFAEQPPSAPWAHGPSLDVFGVRPDEIPESTFVRDLLHSVDHPDLVQQLDIGGQAAVHAEDRVLYQRRQRQVVEYLCAVLPWVGIAVLPHALVVEAVHLGDLSRLVVAADQRDATRIADLEQYQQLECLNAVVTSVYEVAHEDVVLLRNLPTDVEQLQHVEELAVDVTTDHDRKLDRLNIVLLDEKVLKLLACHSQQPLGQYLVLVPQARDPDVWVQITTGIDERRTPSGEYIHCR
mmetsp:Transcript_86454/g.242040  ORF Transcript_86454/g.242040 Transcript_86454/m.242040 type:complete len:255 (+) Transcript_86454:315-1079(+)